MGDVVDLDEYRQRKLSKQFDAHRKKKPSKQVLRERRENEQDEEYSHPSRSPRKNKEWDDD